MIADILIALATIAGLVAVGVVVVIFIALFTWEH